MRTTAYSAKRLSNKEQQHLYELANKLIFVRKLQFSSDIQTDVATMISEIKKQFLELLPKFDFALYKHLEDTISRTEVSEAIKNDWRKIIIQLYIKEIYELPNGEDEGWLEFTPYLMKKRKGLSCHSAAIVLGAISEMLNVKFDMGRVSDHSVLIYYFGNERYYTDPYQGSFWKFSNEPIQHEFYNLYRMSSDEELETEPGRYGFLVTEDFNGILLESILLNIEALRRVSYGDTAGVPFSQIRPLQKFVKKHKDILQKDNWGKIARKLFPNASLFQRHKNGLWVKEEERIADLRSKAALKKEFDGSRLVVLFEVAHMLQWMIKVDNKNGCMDTLQSLEACNIHPKLLLKISHEFDPRAEEAARSLIKSLLELENTFMRQVLDHKEAALQYMTGPSKQCRRKVFLKPIRQYLETIKRSLLRNELDEDFRLYALEKIKLKLSQEN